jgi:pimeloyl-ACP methyl ester carboxylesterase
MADWIGIILLVLVILLLAAGYYLARVAIYPKVFTPEEIYRGEMEKGYSIEEIINTWPKKEVQIHSPAGYDLNALYLPLGDSQKTVILNHGITMGLFQMIVFSSIFRRHGFNVLVYDLRNHGRSGGENTTFGFYEKHDLKAVVDWAFNQLKPGGKIGTMGLSLGAATALQHAAIDPRLSFIIVDCPYSNIFELFRFRLKEDYHLPAFPILHIGMWLIWFITSARLQSISPRDEVEKFDTPLLIIHGQEDTYIKPEMSVELYEHKTRGIRKLWLAPNAGHAESYDKNPEEYARQVQAFLEEIHLI